MIKFRGKTYTSIAKLCSELDIPYSKFCRYHRETGSLEKAYARYLDSYKVEYKGAKYKSINALCKALGLDKARFYYYYSKTNSIEDAVQQTRQQKRNTNSISISYNGCVYTSIHSFCAAFSLNKSKFMKVYDESIPIEEVILKSKKRTKICYKGKTYKSIKSFCIEQDLDYQQFKKFYNIGYTIEEAIVKSKQIRSKRRGELEYRGIHYKSALELCQSLNIPYISFTKYLRQGLSVEEALSEINKKIVFKTEDGVVFYTYANLCEYYGISYTTFCHSGPKKDLSHDEIKNRIEQILSKQRKKYICNGKEYSSFYKFCMQHHINYSKALTLLKKGLSGEEILSVLIEE